MNGVPDLVLFDLGATRSFVSLNLSKRFDDASWKLDYPLEVEIVNDHPMMVSRVHRGCVLELLASNIQLIWFLFLCVGAM